MHISLFFSRRSTQKQNLSLRIDKLRHTHPGAASFVSPSQPRTPNPCHPERSRGTCPQPRSAPNNNHPPPTLVIPNEKRNLAQTNLPNSTANPTTLSSRPKRRDLIPKPPIKLEGQAPSCLPRSGELRLAKTAIGPQPKPQTPELHPRRDVLRRVQTTNSQPNRQPHNPVIPTEAEGSHSKTPNQPSPKSGELRLATPSTIPQPCHSERREESCQINAHNQTSPTHTTPHNHSHPPPRGRRAKRGGRGLGPGRPLPPTYNNLTPAPPKPPAPTSPPERASIPPPAPHTPSKTA